MDMTQMTKDYLRMLAGLPTGTNATGAREFASVMEAKKLPEEMTDEQFEKYLKKNDITGAEAKAATKKRKAAIKKLECAITEEASEHEYDSSSDFTEEFEDATKKVQDLKAFIDSPRLAHWLKETDSNFDGAAALSKLPSLKSAIAEIEKLMSELDDHLTDLSS